MERWLPGGLGAPRKSVEAGEREQSTAVREGFRAAPGFEARAGEGGLLSQTRGSPGPSGAGNPGEGGHQ